MRGPLLQVRVLSGSAANGNIPVGTIAGMKDPGSKAEKTILGNQAIGKTEIKDTDGRKAAGRNKVITP